MRKSIFFRSDGSKCVNSKYTNIWPDGGVNGANRVWTWKVIEHQAICIIYAATFFFQRVKFLLEEFVCAPLGEHLEFSIFSSQLPKHQLIGKLLCITVMCALSKKFVDIFVPNARHTRTSMAHNLPFLLERKTVFASIKSAIIQFIDIDVNDMLAFHVFVSISSQI